MPRVLVIFIGLILVACLAQAQTTQPVAVAPAPATQPTPQAVLTTRPTNRSAEDMLRQMLQPQGQAAQPLKPIPDLPPQVDMTGGVNAVLPNATTQPLTREGSLLLDRVGRLTPGADGKSFELTLEGDNGTLLADPPLVLLPCRKLMQLEDQVENAYLDQKLRVSGEVMEYRGRNYLLLQRWNVIPDSVKPLQ